MKGIVTALWQRPAVFAGALSAANAALIGYGVLSPGVGIGLAVAVAIANVAANNPPPSHRR
jgi:hypothetical protein